MKKSLAITLSAAMGVAVIFVGAETFACNDKAKTASSDTKATYALDGAGCPALGSAGCAAGKSAQFAGNTAGACETKSTKAQTAGAGCCPGKSSKAAHADMASSSKSSCGSSAQADWASALCGSKGFYAANVFAVRSGQPWAVCQGHTFPVTTDSPYADVGSARYYFADEASRVRCAETLKAIAPSIDREVVSLATAEGNVVATDADGKWAQCVSTGEKFLVTADSPVRVADGRKYYLVHDLSTIVDPAH